MKGKPSPKKKNRRSIWIVDESKCLRKREVKRLQGFCLHLKNKGLQDKKFTAVRNWIMIELGLNTGLRVQEMASLKHSNLFLDEGRSSISFIGNTTIHVAEWNEDKTYYIKCRDKFLNVGAGCSAIVRPTQNFL